MAGRKSKYDTVIEPNLNNIEKWLKSGEFTNNDICKKLGINKDTFYKYAYREKTALSDLVKKNNESVDKNYESLYFKNLNGYYVEEVTTNYIYKEDGNGKYIKIPTSEVKQKKYIKANDSMYIFAAKNKLNWTDKQELRVKSVEDDPITKAIKENINK